MTLGFQPVVTLRRDHVAKTAPPRDWTQDELAQFYRVEWALGQAGISVETERGLSDEGDPWFAFCKAQDGEVVIHIAREGPFYVLAGFLSDGVQRGRDFASLVEQLLAQHPAKSLDRRDRSNVIMHPATMLALLVSIAILQSTNEGKAAADGEGDGPAPLLKQHAAPAIMSQALPATATLPPPASAGRVAPASAATSSPLVATLEMAQAMSILLVASLAGQEPAHASALQPGSADGLKPSFTAAPIVERAYSPTGLSGASKDAAPQTAPQHQDADGLPHASAGVEKLLEIVAKLWTMPIAATVMPAAISVETALAFFKGEAAGPTDFMASQPKPASSYAAFSLPEKTAPAAPPALAEPPIKEVKPAEEAKPTAQVKDIVQIVHTPGSAETTAQTVLKLSGATIKELTLEAASASDSSKLLVMVSELVTLAKSAQSLDSAKPGLGKSDLAKPDLAKPELTKADLSKADLSKADTTKSTDPGLGKQAPLEPTETAKEPAEKGGDAKVAGKAATDTSEISITTLKGSMVKHDVLNDDAVKTTIDKALAAFTEDVGHVSMAINGKDIIYYSAEAIVQHSKEVVVEIWQFKDGSSISLVGVGLDGPLPYSL